MRPSKRTPDQMREVTVERGFSRHAEGSCLIKFGNTHVLCTASLEERIPPWLRGKGEGWVTAEYGMLPRSTHDRMRREATAGKQSGRTSEIQRLIGRSLRAVVDMKELGERQITVDCDVIQADGGTRTASITGGYIALRDCINWMKERSMVTDETDANFVMTGKGGIVEIQGTAEDEAFSREELNQMMDLATAGIADLVKLQNEG